MLTALVFTTALPAPAQARDQVLLVGNSFTAGVRNKLRWLARSGGHNLYAAARASDGWTLQDHLRSRSTAGKIRSSAWTWIVLQEQSDGIDWERYPSARGLAAEVADDGANTVFFMTWRNRNAELADYDALRGVPGGDTGYVPIAFELGAALAPVGWAFRESVVDDPAVDLWSDDGHHANERGRYLAALVLYATLYGESPVGLWAPSSVSPEDALHDQLLVERVVLSNPADWNLSAAAR